MLAGSSCLAQSRDGLRYNVNYKCNGETVSVGHCRHDSDMPGFPATTPQNDYCAVYYPDRPAHNGIIVPSAILRSEIVRQLQACGALPSSQVLPPREAGTAPELMELANKYMVAKDYPKALEQYQKAVQLLPNDKSARHGLGSAEAALGRIDDALATYRVLERLSADDANNLFMEITKADDEAGKKQTPVAKRAEAYRNLDSSALLAKANQGDDAAMKRLSDLYHEKKDSANGLNWKIKAAERGDPDLQNDLGWYFANTPPKNVIEARKWYTKAGEQGWEDAELNLCKSYATELDLDQGVLSGADKDNRQSPFAPIRGSTADIDEAFRWCERAGDRGLTEAAWDAGVLNAKGSLARAPNYADAYFWLTYGGLQAGEVFRENVGTHLTAAKRAEMEKLAAGFRPDAMTLFHDMMQKGTAPRK